jgi:hypothetical protein
MHPLRNDFGSIAAIAAVLRQSPEAESYSAGAAQGWSASHEPWSHVFVVTRSFVLQTCDARDGGSAQVSACGVRTGRLRHRRKKILKQMNL